MSTIFADGFDHYGADSVGQLNMLDGVWAQLDDTCRPEKPTFGARTGDYALKIRAASGTNIARRVLGSAKTTVISSFALYRPALPEANDTSHIIQWSDGANNLLFEVNLQSTGVLEFKNAAGTVLGTSSIPVITAAAWNHIECKLVVNATSGSFELRVNESAVINVSSINTGSVGVEQVRFSISDAGSDITDFWIDDLVLMDDASALNNNFQGDVKVVTLFPSSDNPAVNGWTPRARKRFGPGILSLINPNFPTTPAYIRVSDNAAFEMGSGDFTLETQARFLTLPTGTDRASLFAKWDEAGNKRSYELFKGGPSLNSGDLVFRISTDGTAGTVTNVFSFPWTPQLDQWYHIAVSRNSGTLRVYIDGVLLGAPATDTATYFDGTARFAMGADSVGKDGSGFVGFMNEIRATKGVGRYPTEFTPPSSAFPRSAPGDPDFASVSLLAGFGSGISDKSSHAFSISALNGAVQEAPADGDFDYQTLNQSAPRDDTFMDASLVAATGTLTLTAKPLDGETVTIGSQTYTFKTIIGAADTVLIGADASASIDNLISAIINAGGEGTLYGTGTTPNAVAKASGLPGDLMLVTATAPGSAGNSIATTETLSNGSFGAATLSGGVDIPGPSQFGLQDLPQDVTQVRSLTIVNRSKKSDSGSGTLQTSFVVSDGSLVNGAANALTTALTYREDVFETDPSTAAGLTPSSIVGAEIKINRTA